MRLTIIPASFITNPKYFQTLHFALVGTFRCSVELPVLLLVLLLTNSVSLICFSIYRIKILNWHTHASIDIKVFFWYRDSKFHIDILVYRYISPIPTGSKHGSPSILHSQSPHKDLANCTFRANHQIFNSPNNFTYTVVCLWF